MKRDHDNKRTGSCFFPLAMQVMCHPNSRSLAPQELLLLSLSAVVKWWLFVWGCNPIWRLQQIYSASLFRPCNLRNGNSHFCPFLCLFRFCSVREDPTPPFYIWPPCVSPESEVMVNKGLLQKERVDLGKKTLCKSKSCFQKKLGKWRG